jgi:hypothetical protein
MRRWWGHEFRALSGAAAMAGAGTGFAGAMAGMWWPEPRRGPDHWKGPGGELQAMATIIPCPAPAPGEPGEALFLALMEARDSGAVVFGVVVEFVRREAAGGRAFHRGKGSVAGPE